jgi:hypothetical protein
VIFGTNNKINRSYYCMVCTLERGYYLLPIKKGTPIPINT